MSKSQVDRIFEEVLKNAEDISNAYSDNTVLRKKLTDSSQDFEDFLAKVREKMQDAGPIGKIDAVSRWVVTEIEKDHRLGLIAAVDGTDALIPTEVSSKTVYAAGVISTTALTLNEPCISMTASHHVIPTLRTDDDFMRFIASLDSFVDHEQSWVKTFREHCEREEALGILSKNPEMKLVLIDGPLYTQNLLTQSRARDGILQKMLGQSGRLIGFIKNLQSSKITHLAGMALRPGEYWTLENWRQVLGGRFLNTGAATDWITKAASDWVRTVYRKNNKAFSFECDPVLVESGIALISSRVCCADIFNHEIPFLLHAADRIVQARMDAKAKSDNLISGSPFYANLANERMFR
jgi:hypothetical protein